MQYYILIALVIISLIIIIYQYWESYNLHKNFLLGYWEASTDFCNEAGLLSASVMIQKEKIYIHMETPKGNLSKCVDYTINSNQITFNEDMSPLPESINYKLIILNCNLILFDDQKVYLDLYKRSDIVEV